MGLDIVTSLLAAIVSLAAGGIVSSEPLQRLLRRLLKLPEKKSASYAERLSSLTQKLDAASGEVDQVLREIAQVAENRQKTVNTLEKDLQQLETKERDLKNRISVLQNTPLPVADHFAELMTAGEKRNARRDYLLFGAGVASSTIVALGIQFLSH